MDITGFLENKTPDHRGRTLSMILAFSDKQAKQTHNYMQWLFRLDEPSGSVHVAQANLTKASEWFFQFLIRNPRWIAKYDHNQLWITRVIKSLRLLVGNKEADKFRQSIFDHLGEDVTLISENAKSFWNSAGKN